MFNFYDFVKDNHQYRQFSVDSLLFTVYDCFIDESPLNYWTQKNYFCLTMEGKLKWKTLAREYLISEGDVIFVKKGAHRVYKVEDGGEYCALIIFLPDDFIADTIKSHLPASHHLNSANENDSVIPLEMDSVLTTYFRSLLNYFHMPAPPSKHLLKIKFEELIMTILNSTTNPSLSDYFRDLCCNHKRSVTSVIEDNFTFNLKLSELAGLCNRSLSSFKRDFIKIYNTTPAKWLRNKKLHYARFLLETTDMNINQITMESGFENTSHFIKLFKDTFDHPPNHYKKQRELSL